MKQQREFCFNEIRFRLPQEPWQRTTKEADTYVTDRQISIPTIYIPEHRFQERLQGNESTPNKISYQETLYRKGNKNEPL